jgi:hypothetical protein
MNILQVIAAGGIRPFRKQKAPHRGAFWLCLFPD